MGGRSWKNSILWTQKKKKYKTESKEKQRELHAFEQRLGKLEKDNQRLETEKQKRKNDLKDTENKKPKIEKRLARKS